MNSINETPAQAIVALATARNLSDLDLYDLMESILVGGPVDFSDELAALIRDSFSGDDSYDDLRHEMDHVTGVCDDDDSDCIWADDDED